MLLVMGGLALLVWRSRPSPAACAAAGALLGAAALTRTVGMVLLLPALLYVVVRWVGALRIVLLTLGFAVPILGYAAAFDATWGQFSVTKHDGYFLYGRVSTFANCSNWNVPPAQRGLCFHGPPGAAAQSELLRVARVERPRVSPPPVRPGQRVALVLAGGDRARAGGLRLDDPGRPGALCVLRALDEPLRHAVHALAVPHHPGRAAPGPHGAVDRAPRRHAGARQVAGGAAARLPAGDLPARHGDGGDPAGKRGGCGHRPPPAGAAAARRGDAVRLRGAAPADDGCRDHDVRLPLRAAGDPAAVRGGRHRRPGGRRPSAHAGGRPAFRPRRSRRPSPADPGAEPTTVGTIA